MNKFKIGDRVRASKDSEHSAPFKMGWHGIVEDINANKTQLKVKFDSYYLATPDEIELIEPLQLTEQDKEWLSSRPTIADKHTPKPFPTFDEFITWVQNLNGNWMLHDIYNYFAQFKYEKTVEVFPEVGKEYEFSMNGERWFKSGFDSYKTKTLMYPTHIRPIQPNRLEQLKAKHPNLSNDELIELLDILLTQMRE